MATKRASPARPDLPEKSFATRAALRTWLDGHHASCPGIWILLAKKHSGHRAVSYLEAVEEGLCFGWIDGQAKTSDRVGFFRVRFVPRRPRSVWSKINRDKALALIEAGLMRPAGLAAIEAAKAGGQWDRAYDGASAATVPDELAAALHDNAKAAAFFETLDRTNRYAVIWRVQTATTPATRARRVAALVDKLARGERLHPTTPKAPSSKSRAASPRLRVR
ncbi:MAG: YdeI/OmpD-associated family protein [Acidobacteria bacterium]|nr:YdeI/OmpD-associated family protein [Acidobacteriota bacterium]